MTTRQIERVTSQLARFLEALEDDTALFQVNICRGGLTGITVVPPAGEIKHYSASAIRELTSPTRRGMVIDIDN